ncbi:DNA polymerase alpha catalytic subunit-like [Vespa mandarinia]|uniref:DNA polymerase alpha catalytic subunit-like n=1 Tax=Vespa mandarinia TaxID=7446 RepID=UPI00160BB345|nr:DNA polymerase alpha catalytic subunit-like [Vespa mandarinia]
MSEAQESPSGRTRRQKSGKSACLLALQKLKQLKGSKHKYEIDELENVYEEVDEQEYSKTVIKRQNDDWIVDDGESGYIEDGREIFDDDLDESSIQHAMKHGNSGPRKKKKNITKSKKSIQDMIMLMPSNKKVNNTVEDDILGDLMSELKKEDTKKVSDSNDGRAKFCKTYCINNMSNQDVESKKKVTTSDNDICLSMDISNDSDNDEPMFGTLEKIDSKKKSININKTSNNDARPQSTSQEITNDVSDESQSLSIDKCSSVKEVSASQIIEDESLDISEYVGDLFEVDFENSSLNENEHLKGSVSTISKPENHTKTKSLTLCKDSDILEENSEIFNQIWNDDFGMQATNVEVSAENADVSIPFIKNSAGEQIFRFYWWDAYEDSFKQPGIVYLFGKVYVPSTKTYCSCCLTVKNIPRRIYLLPREFIKNSSDSEPRQTSIHDVYKEFNEFANKSGIKEFRSSQVSKYYAFEQEDTPKFSDYLEVRYSTNYPLIDSGYSGPAIEKIFGTTVKSLELLLIERNIKGPCWLDVKCAIPTGIQTSWCKLNITCMKMENISVSSESQNLAIPPMVIATLNVRVSAHAKSQQNEVVMVGILLHHKYNIDKERPKPPHLFKQSFCLITKPRDIPWPRQVQGVLSKIKYTTIIRCENEHDLLEELLKIIENVDPDLFIGYDCGFQFDVLLHRIFNLRVSNWSRIGKLKRSVHPIIKGKINIGQAMAGRPLCDIQISAKELNLKVRSYDLQSLCIAVLKQNENEYKELKPGECPLFYNTVEKMENLIKRTLMEASYILSITFELEILPLALQITSIAGNILSRTLSAGRAERNEYLLLHAFHLKNYITPDKQQGKLKKDIEGDNPRRKKAAYAGGLVLTAQKGFYDTLILLMDFNSLYPSIIQEYNLCFTTVPGAAYADYEDLEIPDSSLEPGVIPTEIRKLVESRVEIKKLMKAPNISSELKVQYNIRQMALKLTANSMYGCLGATHCRFYAKGLAALITSKGREILQDTKRMVEKLNYDVIYGDTDSIMIKTNILDYDEVFSIGKKIKQEVNKLYKKVELDIDGVFRYLLLLQKKKYAAVTMTKLPNGKIQLNQEHKGLDIVRRDWCQLACETGKRILNQLFSEQSNDTRVEEIFSILQTVSKSVRENQVPLSSLIVTKQLSKNPHEYPDRKQAHVSVALRLNKEGGRMWKVGDTISYIICEDGTDKSATERAYHIDEFKKKDNLKIDINYYLMNQILPVVLRICEPIEGIDDVLLARNLGLENVYKSKATVNEQNNFNAPILINEDRFKYCFPLKFNCKNEKCKAEVTLNGVTSLIAEGNRLSLGMCPNPECTMPPWKYLKAIQNELQLALRSLIDTYYESWLECENPLCSYRTKKLPLTFNAKYPKCPKCMDAFMHRVYSDMQLYNQICFYHHIFDINQPQYKSLLSNYSREVISAYETLRETTEKFLKCNAYSVINLGAIFTCKHSKYSKRSNNFIENDVSYEETPNTENLIIDESDDEFIINLSNKTFLMNTDT